MEIAHTKTYRPLDKKYLKKHKEMEEYRLRGFKELIWGLMILIEVEVWAKDAPTPYIHLLSRSFPTSPFDMSFDFFLHNKILIWCKMSTLKLIDCINFVERQCQNDSITT